MPTDNQCRTRAFFLSFLNFYFAAGKEGGGGGGDGVGVGVGAFGGLRLSSRRKTEMRFQLNFGYSTVRH